MSKLKTFFSLLKETFQEWNEDRVPRLAAALAYYTVFSLAPFLIVVMAIAGLVFGQEAVQGRLDEQIQGLVGREGADMVQELIQNIRQPENNIIATVIGLITLFLGAGGVFGQLQDALNTVWGVEPKPGLGLLATIKNRFLSFTMVLGVGFLLMVSLVVSTVLTTLNSYVLGFLPGSEILLRIIDFLISFGVITLLFALMYKYLPDVEIRWRDVWVGAAVTALLFTIGKYLLGFYLGNSGVLSTYGAAGSVVIILLWVFYSAQILLFGAEFTQVYAQKFGGYIRPSENAVAVTAEMRAKQGLPASEKAVTHPAPLTSRALGLDNADGPMPLQAPADEPKKFNWFKDPIVLGLGFIGLLVGIFLGSQKPSEDA